MHIGNKAYTFSMSHLESDPKNILARELTEGEQEQSEEELYTALGASGANNRIEWSENGSYLVEIEENGF